MAAAYRVGLPKALAVSSIMKEQHARSEQSWIRRFVLCIDTVYPKLPHNLGASRDAAYSGVVQSMKQPSA
jgi:hypothetical protein